MKFILQILFAINLINCILCVYKYFPERRKYYIYYTDYTLIISINIIKLHWIHLEAV